MTVRLSFILRVLGLTVACVWLVSCAPTKPKFTHEQEEFLNEARHLYICLFSCANDWGGTFPESLKGLLAEAWDLDESLIYQNPDAPREVRIHKWHYNSNQMNRLGTCDDPDAVLFSSSNGPGGVVALCFVDGRVLLLNKAGEILIPKRDDSIRDPSPKKKYSFPRLIVVIGNERLSYYENWKAEEVIAQVKSLAAAIVKVSGHNFNLVRFQSGTMSDSSDYHKQSPRIYLNHDKSDGWYFVEYPPEKTAKFHRHDNRTFSTPEKAVEWYIEEYLKPLL